MPEQVAMDYSGPNANRYYPLTIAEVIDETSDARSLVFSVPAGLEEVFRYRPGQFLTLRIPHSDGVLARCYSLSSAPGIDTQLRVTIKRVSNGRASNWICDQLQKGATVDVLPPTGIFVPRNLDGDFALFAGGSGITPILSIIKALMARGTGRAWIFYANRDESSVIFRDELKTLAAAYPQRLSVQHWLDSIQGVPSCEQLRALIERNATAQACQYFICGPAPFMDGAHEALKALKVPRDQIHIERFVSLATDPGSAVPAPNAAGSAVNDLEVVLDGIAHAVSGRAGESLLDSMLRAGLAAPNSCRSGSCGACMCKLEEGEVALRANAVLDSDDLAEGWTLACQGVPTSAAVRVRFPD